ncbi:exonuclease SbcCD subunit D C-terminal domain-containing protein [Halomonas sp. YLGW01]|uniref:exonuclease SbcCD subunit D C-terminal domain-containing protein n=1 Tax=Halomonas sp. YLGW01 TaxID=2773308 RepID=UPI001781E938|nr:exonuclease SbcCD subunit D C-terminal domain-containing protein [Halomonas sp. YLGW01]
MKLIHTSDWHLGQTFHGQERHVEHRAFLTWLLQTLDVRQADALLVAGDLFDVVNPSLKAQELLYDFIVEAHRRLPTLDIVLIAGNHDSGNRVELPAPLMKRLNTHALGRVHWQDDGSLDAERLLVPLTDAAGETRAWCLALPFLRPAEVTGRTGPAASKEESSASDGRDDTADRHDYVAGIGAVHEQLIAAARDRRQPDQALIAMSHAHLRGAAVSEASERPIVIGGEESLSASLFPDDIAYVALGHLHRPQQVGDARIRYSGSPIPLDFSEVDYPHQVVEVTLEGDTLAATESLPIPRSVALKRLGPADLDTVLAELEALEDDPDLPTERRPWLELRVDLDGPQPDLRARVEAALEGRALRLLRIHTRYPKARGEAAGSRRVTLDSLGPQALFARAWEEEYGEPADEAVTRDFAQLLQEVMDEDVMDDEDASHTSTEGARP